MAKNCLEEIKMRLEKNKERSKWEKERMKFYRKRGLDDEILWKRRRRCQIIR